MKIFSTLKLGNIELNNRIIMAPMTRSRATGNIPNDSMAEYYAIRADAGLLITEGTAPSANGLGYPRIPGIYSQAQIKGWKKVTDAVHAKGGKIFIQLMHTGRISHPLNMEQGTQVVAPSAIQAVGQMYTDAEGMKAHPVPKEMTKADILATQEEYVQSAKNAIEASFDGVEIHGANGYLIDQFNNAGSNHRTDEYGGSTENRSRFALEVAKKISEAIGADKTGIRLSPFGVYNDMAIFDGLEEQFVYLATELGKLNLAYLHIVDHSSQGAPEVPQSIKDKMNEAFDGIFIASGGLNKEKAEGILNNGQGDLVAFGVPFLANPDLVERFKNNAELNAPDMGTFFTPGEKGYLDYPTLETA